ncbi:MAG TPA: hypothetical protein VK431_04585 [Nitrosopumilaceae archaeon]|nr:hypothetical protein [Nitrosopumilaceae archaeon]
MFPIRTNNRKAISVVMTTMIILVASVVLGTGVVIYGTSLFQTGGQQQSIASQGLKLWINSTAQGTTYYAWGAAAVRNNGDVLASVNTIQIRGASVPFNAWFVNATQSIVNSGTNFQAQFNLTRTDMNGNPIGSLANGGIVSPATTCTQTPRNTTPFTTLVIDEDGSGASAPLCLKQASGPTALNPGDKMIVYFKIPNGVLSPVDSGSAVTVNLYAGNVGGPTTVQVGNP